MEFSPDISPFANRSEGWQPALVSRCFRTNGKGGIPLRRDWAALFGTFSPLPLVAVQTRHAFARLVAITRPPVFVTGSDPQHASDESGALRFDLSTWHRACGYLTLCHCCSSPGYTEVLNAHGSDFLRICAMPSCAPFVWAACLDQLVEDNSQGVPLAPSRARFGMPGMLPDSVSLSAGAEVLPKLFDLMGTHTMPLRCVLRTADVGHTRDFIPESVLCGAGTLTAGSPEVKLQLTLECVQRLTLGRAGGDSVLQVIGPDDRLLLTLGAASEEGALEAWHRALRTVFPNHV